MAAENLAPIVRLGHNFGATYSGPHDEDGPHSPDWAETTKREQLSFPL